MPGFILPLFFASSDVLGLAHRTDLPRFHAEAYGFLRCGILQSSVSHAVCKSSNWNLCFVIIQVQSLTPKLFSKIILGGRCVSSGECHIQGSNFGFLCTEVKSPTSGSVINIFPAYGPNRTLRTLGFCFLTKRISYNRCLHRDPPVVDVQFF